VRAAQRVADQHAAVAHDDRRTPEQHPDAQHDDAGERQRADHLGEAVLQAHGHQGDEGDEARGHRQGAAVPRRELQSGTHMPMLAEPQVATVRTGHTHRAQEGS
jgi:hypothetical protein